MLKEEEMNVYTLIAFETVVETNEFLDLKEWLKKHPKVQGVHTIFKRGEVLMKFERRGSKVLWERPHEKSKAKTRLENFWMR
jgi:hypothetical protein